MHEFCLMMCRDNGDSNAVFNTHILNHPSVPKMLTGKGDYIGIALTVVETVD